MIALGIRWDPILVEFQFYAPPQREHGNLSKRSMLFFIAQLFMQDLDKVEIEDPQGHRRPLGWDDTVPDPIRKR